MDAPSASRYHEVYSQWQHDPEGFWAKRAEELVILADSSKLGARGSLALCRLEAVHTLITDTGISDGFAKTAEAEGVKLIVV